MSYATGVSAYLASPDTAARIAMLRGGTQLPVELARDLLELDLEFDERVEIVRALPADDPTAEALVLGQLRTWDGSFAAQAFRWWLRETPRSERTRLLTIVGGEPLPQRLLFLMIEGAPRCGGRELLARLAEAADLASYSEATHALLLHRLLQFDIEAPVPTMLAQKAVTSAVEQFSPRSPVLAVAVPYLARFQPQTLAEYLTSPVAPAVWADHIRAVMQWRGSPEAVLDVETFYASWPPLWARSTISAETLTNVLSRLSSAPLPQDLPAPIGPPIGWDSFAGIARSTLVVAAASLDEMAKTLLEPLLEATPAPKREAKAPTPSTRTAFFDLAFRAGKAAAASSDLWGTLAQALADPKATNLPSVVKQTRTLTGPFELAAHSVFERFASREELLLELQPAFTSKDPARLRSAARAAAGINTRGALAAVLKQVGRPELPASLRQELLQAIEGLNLKPLQSDLRALLKDLRTRTAGATLADRELAEAVGNLVTYEDELAPVVASAATAKSPDPDADLAKLLPSFRSLPSDVVRIFRTARVVAATLREGPHAASMDLSPAVDMQCKGVEVLVRQLLEPRCLALIESGALAHQLDLLGYSRGSRADTDRFESFLAGLPIIRDVPGFNTYKLNKVLRAIAAHRRGKRFSFDGLKGTAVFLLAFGRRTCPHGLANVFTHGFADDQELAAYIRDLHVFQDIRNRAVHDGLSAQSARDVDALWHLTASLVTRTSIAAR